MTSLQHHWTLQMPFVVKCAGYSEHTRRIRRASRVALEPELDRGALQPFGIRAPFVGCERLVADPVDVQAAAGENHCAGRWKCDGVTECRKRGKRVCESGVAFGGLLYVDIEPDRFERQGIALGSSRDHPAALVPPCLGLQRKTKINIARILPSAH